MDEKQTALAALKSFHASGIITVPLPDEMIKANGGVDTVSHFKFEVFAKGDRIKEVVQTLTATGEVTRTQTYYLDTKRITEVDDMGGKLIAKTFTLGKEINTGIFNVCPIFFEYAFLNGSIQYPGIPALLISDLSSKKKWDTMVASAQNVTSIKAGENELSIQDTNGKIVIDLKGSSDLGQLPQVSAIEFFDKENILLRKLELLDSITDKTFGKVGTGYKVSVYNVTADNKPITWVYKINDIKFNVPFDDESLEHDPASVDTIFDGDNKTYIVIPK